MRFLMFKAITCSLLALSLAACSGGPVGDIFSDGPGTRESDGSETRNGGYGVRIGDSIYSLDLNLRGSHLRPYLSENTPITLDEHEIAAIRHNLDGIVDEETQNIVMRKFSDLRAKLAQAKIGLQTGYMLNGVDWFTWTLLEGVRCKDVGDNEAPVENTVQVAYRQGRYIRLCDDFTKMDKVNQAALIFHEIVYSSLKEKSLLLELTGLVFNKDFENPREKVWTELGFIADKLYQQSGSAPMVHVYEPLKIAPEVLAQLGGNPCFARAAVGPFSYYAFWGAPAGEKCPTGDVYSKSILIFSEYSGSLSLAGTGKQVGTIAGGVLTSLCPEGRVCVLEPFDFTWQIRMMPQPVRVMEELPRAWYLYDFEYVKDGRPERPSQETAFELIAKSEYVQIFKIETTYDDGSSVTTKIFDFGRGVRINDPESRLAEGLSVERESNSFLRITDGRTTIRVYLGDEKHFEDTPDDLPQDDPIEGTDCRDDQGRWVCEEDHGQDPKVDEAKEDEPQREQPKEDVPKTDEP